MGVSLSLDDARQARGRSRGQHTRSAEEQACLDALSAFLRSDALAAGRCLSKVPRASLASRLLPAARALARAADLMLGSDPEPARNLYLGAVLSPSCLLGSCEPPYGGNPCESPACEHGCHAGSDGARLPVPAGRSWQRSG